MMSGESAAERRQEGWSRPAAVPPLSHCARGRCTSAVLSDDRSGQQLLHDVAVYVGQAEVTPLILERQALVIDAEDVQQRGVEVVDVHAILDDAVTEIVGL